MRHAQTNGPFLKTALVLWVLALCGVFLVLPYVATLENNAPAAAVARAHLEVRELLAISVVPNCGSSGLRWSLVSGQRGNLVLERHS